MRKLLYFLLVSVITLTNTLMSAVPVAGQGFQPLLILPEQGAQVDATRCNTEDVKKGKRTGWNDVAFGAEINDGDYLNLVLAVSLSVKNRDADALVTFFQNQTDELIDKLGPEVEQMGKRAIADLLTRVFFDSGKTQHILEGGLELEAGIARINCRLEVTYAEPRTYQCKQHFGSFCPSCWTWSICTTTDQITRGFDWFPKYLPYIRYRTNENLPQFPFKDLGLLVRSIQNNLENLRELDKKLREELAQSEQEIQQRLKQEASEIISLEVGGAIESRISVIPRYKYLPLLREIVARVLDHRGFSAVTLDTILNNLANDLTGLLQETITEFNARIKEVISTQPGSLVLDWASSNRAEKRAEIMGTGEWHVVWGVNVDEIEQANLLAAIAAAIPTGGASLAQYFGTYLEKTVTKIQGQAPEIGRKVLLELVAKAMKERGKVFKAFNIEVQADIATYDRWGDFDYPKIDFKRCSVTILGKDYEYACGLTITKGVQKVNLPNHYQPYIKFRFTDGKTAQPSGSNPVETQTYYHGANNDYFSGCDGNLNPSYVNGSATNGSDGSIFHPFQTVNAAVECVKNGGAVLISPGLYEEVLVINKPMTLRSLQGIATIKAPLSTLDGQPRLKFDTSEISIEVTQGDANPEAISAAIGRSGNGLLTWEATASPSWLQVSPTKGAAPATLQISIDTSSLAPGKQTGEISISAGAQVIKRSVTIVVNEKAADSTVSLTPNSFNLDAPKSDSTSESQAFTLTNSSNIQAEWTASASVPWLKLSADSGVTPSVINVWANLDGLPAGNHTGEIRVVFDAQALTLPIIITVSEPQRQLFLPLVTK